MTKRNSGESTTCRCIRVAVGIATAGVLSCGYRDLNLATDESAANEGAGDVLASTTQPTPAQAGAAERRDPDERPAVLAPVPPPPISGGTLMITQDGELAVAADPARDQISIVEIESGVVSSTLHLETGAKPGRLAEDSAGGLHVLLTQAGQLLDFDVTGQLLSTRAVCAEPRGLTADLAERRLLVACRDGRLLSLPEQGGEATLLAQLDSDLRDVVVTAPSDTEYAPRIVVSRFRSAELLQLDTDGSLLERTRFPSVTEERFEVIVDETDPDAPAAELLTDSPFVADVAWRMVTHDGSVMVLHQRARADEIKPPASGGGYGGGCDAVVHPVISVVTPGGNVAAAPNLGAARLAVDLAVSADGARFAVADAGGRDPGAPTGFEAFDSLAGAAPAQEGPAIVEEPDAPWVARVYPADQVREFSSSSEQNPCGTIPNERISGQAAEQATAVAFSPTHTGQLIAFVRQPPQLLIRDMSADTAERRISLPGGDITDTGHDLFHRVDSAVACAQCHPEGTEDGRTWQFEQFGLRRTQSLEGHVSRPFHWDGALADLDALMEEVFVGRMSGAPQAPDRVAALERWLGSLSPSAPPAVADPQLVEQGRQLFESEAVGCASCHSGDELTDGQLHDVGTSDVPLKTASLRGAALRLPLMHDGCATTMADRFLPECGGEQHGSISGLGEAELQALTAYLNSL